MLRWRLFLGLSIIAVLIGSCWLDGWLDDRASVAGIVLFPLAIFLVALAGREALDLIEATGARPIRWAVHGGNLLVVGCCWGTSVWCGCGVGAAAVDADTSGPWSDAGWFCSTTAGLGTLLAFSAAILLVFIAEMWRFESPRHVTANVAAAVLAVGYVGLSFALIVLLRMAWGVEALASLVIVVKMSDTGAYTVGRLIGRNKMAPKLSPGKTVEGLVGGIAFAMIGAWLTFSWLVPGTTPWWGWAAFGLLVGGAGIVGDLAESLLKRDAGWKDSSRWMPGFGGVLDIFDSLLLAAPVALALWALGLVGQRT